MAIKNISNKSTFYRLAMGTINYGMSNVIAKIIGFFLIPVYTTYLSPKDYGVLELCSSLAVFLIILMRLGVPGSVNRFYFDYKDDESKLRDYVTTVHRLLLLSTAVIGLVVGGILYFYSENFLPGVLFIPFILIILINSSLNANSDLQKRLIQSQEQSAYMAKLNIANVFIGIGLALLFVVGFNMGVLGLFLSQLVTASLFFIQAQYYLRKYVNGSFNTKMLRESLKYGVGILPHHVFIAVAPLLSKGILNYKESTAALGIFSLAMRFIQPLDILYNMFSRSFSPVYFSLRKEGKEKNIKDIYKFVVVGASVLFSVVFLLAPPIIPLITPERFHESASLVPILAIGFLGQVFYLLIIVEVFYNKKTKFISVITGIGVVVNLLLTLALVGKLGVYAITWANSIGFVSWAIAAYFYSDKHVFRYFELKNFGIAFLILLLTVTASFLLQKDALLLRSLAVVGICIFFILKLRIHKLIFANSRVFR